jgi:urease accessory protein
VLATIYIVSKNNSVLQIKEKINLALQDNAEVNGGCSMLPYDCGLVARLLGNSSEEIKTTIYDIMRIVRKEILGTSFDSVRKT